MLAAILPASLAHLLSRRTAARAHAATRRFTAEAAQASNPVQRILDLAVAGDLQGTAAAMDLLTPAELSLTQTLERVAGPPAVRYQHVFENSAVSMGIFLLPAGTIIPLHDHPGMTVLSKILFGEIRRVEMDKPSAKRPRRSFFGRRAHLVCPPSRTSMLRAGMPTVRLDPLRGNIHSFEALNDTAIFDVLLPPYDDGAGRSCHYFEAAAEREGSVELAEVPWPASLRVVSSSYPGPGCAVGQS
jgi:cysteamine dioxygenase